MAEKTLISPGKKPMQQKNYNENPGMVLKLFYFIIKSMLADFIEINSLKAKILKKKPFGSPAQCKLFIKPGFYKPVLAVFLSKNSLNLKKLESLTKTTLCEAGSTESFEITGYYKEWIPPISVYGVILAMDKKADAEKSLFFQIGEEEFLSITPDEIRNANEECIVSDITR